MIEFIDICDDTLNIDCIGWDGYNGEDGVSLGGITKNTNDGYYWFFPTCDQVPLTSQQLRLISDKLTALNK